MTIIKLGMNKASSSAYILESSNLRHGRLGHVNYDTLRKLINLNHIPTFQIDAKHKCETCVEAKLTRSYFQSVERQIEPLDLIHSDICDLKLVQTRGGNKYFITFVDDSNKYCYVYLLKSKDEAIKKFVLYKNEVENQLNKQIKVPRSDQGGEYESPFELWKGIKSSYKYLQVWGCLAKVVVPPPKKVKTGLKTIDCIFMDYAHNSVAYRFLVHESNIPDIHKNTIMESRNASLFEDVFPCKSKVEPNSSKRVFGTINENSQIENDNGEAKPRSSKSKGRKVFWSRFSDLHARRGTSNF